MNNLHKIRSRGNIILTDRQQTVEKLTNNKWAEYTSSYFIWSGSHLDATINLDLLEVVYE